MRMSRDRRRAWRGVAGAAGMFLSAGLSVVTASAAAPLHRFASNTVAFSSDGGHYAAWQENGKPDFVLIDTATGKTRRVPLPPGCELHDEVEGGELIHSA